MIDPSAEAMVGGINTVYRIGETVHRPLGPQTLTVHRLLKHLRANGFTAAPQALGVEGGYEVVSFVPGDVPSAEHRPDIDGLYALGRLLRDYHDATTDFPSRPDDRWYTWHVPPPEPHDVVCHGDIAPYNTVFLQGTPVAFIDFDTARPGPRIWDVGYAVYRFVDWRQPDAAVHARALCDGYRLTARERHGLIDAAIERLDALVTHMHEEAANGNSVFAGHIDAGHDALYRADMQYLGTYRDRFTTIIGNGAVD